MRVSMNHCKRRKARKTNAISLMSLLAPYCWMLWMRDLKWPSAVRKPCVKGESSISVVGSGSSSTASLLSHL